LEWYILFKIYPVYSVAGCHKGDRLQKVGVKFYVIQLCGKCITLYSLVTLSNLFFVILRVVVMIVHLRIYFYAINLLRLNLNTHSVSCSTVNYWSSIRCLHACHLREQTWLTSQQMICGLNRQNWLQIRTMLVNILY